MSQRAGADSRRVGDWFVDAAAHEIVHIDGRRVRLEARAMRVLQLLHRRIGEVVSSEEILDEVWGRKVVSPQSLATVIADLRRELGDDSRNPRYIQTIPKRGYRLLEHVVQSEPLRRTTSRWPAAFTRTIGACAAVAAVMLAISGGNADRSNDSASIESGLTARYVRARELWNRRDHESVLEARRLLQEIVDSNASYAPAYAALADIYAHKTGAELDLPEIETFRAAQRLIDRARELDPHMPELHVTQALLDFYRDHQPRKALASIEVALRADPQFAYAWQTRAMILSAIGEFDASLDAIDRAAALDPASTSIEWDRVWFLYLSRDYETAYARFTQASAHSRPNYLYGALIEQARGRSAESFALWLARFEQKGVAIADRHRLEAAAARGEWSEVYRELAAQSAGFENYEELPIVVATWQLLSGDAVAAGDTLRDRTFEPRDWTQLWRDRMPIFDPLAARTERVAIR